MGMPSEEYWDGNSWLVRAYREAYRMRTEQQDRMADYSAWLTGMYIRSALQSVYLMVNGFVPKGSHAHPYPDKPMYLKNEEERITKRKEEKRRKTEEEKAKESMALFQAMATKFNRNFEKKRKAKEKVQKT